MTSGLKLLDCKTSAIGNCGGISEDLCDRLLRVLTEFSVCVQRFDTSSVYCNSPTLIQASGLFLAQAGRR